MTPELIRKKLIKREAWIKLGALTVILVALLVVLLAIPGMLVSFILAFVITYMFKPIVNRLERQGVGQTTSILIPFLASGFILWILYKVFAPGISDSIFDLQAQFPKYSATLSELFTRHSKTLNELMAKVGQNDINVKLTAWAEKSSAQFLSQIPNWISLSLTTLILSPFFAFFMLRDGQTITREILYYVPNHLFEISMNLIYQINQQLGGFIRARLLESVIVGAVVWVGLYPLGIPYTLFLAIFAGATNLIPYVGPVIGALPGLAVGFVSGSSSTILALIVAVYILAQIIDMLFIIPLVIAKIVDLHPVTVVVVIIIGSQVMGVLGMIISIPVASILKLSFSVFYNHVVDFRA